ncbi:MAG: hypothetical protein AB7U76_25960 [Pirellulales bacterium]
MISRAGESASREALLISGASVNSMPLRETAGAGALGSGEHTPALPGLSQDCPGGHAASAQHTSSTQLPEMQSAGSAHAAPSDAAPLVGVALGVSVGVLVTAAVGLTVGVAVGVSVGVSVGLA